MGNHGLHRPGEGGCVNTAGPVLGRAWDGDHTSDPLQEELTAKYF